MSASEVFEWRLVLEEAPDEPRVQRIRGLFEQVVGDIHDGREEAEV